LHIDHGHQVPLAAFSGTPQWDDTNFDSNMTPQASALNEGAWQRLEARERSLVFQTMSPVYVYTGPLFERLMKPLPNGPEYHRVPSGYWKIVALADGHVSAFVMDQNTPRSANYCDARVPLIDVELRSRLQYFPRLGNVQLASLDSQLGCASPPPPPSPRSEITTH
jgi:endonuclease G